MPTLNVNISAASLARYQDALGKVHQLKDTQDPPQPRVATPAECRDHLIGMGKTFVLNVEQAEIARTYTPPQPQPVDMT